MAFIQAGDQPPGGPFMTVSFKMDITTSGTHNGLFITTGIQNAQGAQMKQFGFVQPQGQLLGGNPLLGASQLSLAPVGFTPQPTAIESGGKVEDRLPTAASIVDIVDEPPPTSSHQQDPNASFVTTSKTSGFSRETSGYSKETSGYSREQTTSTLPPATSSPSVFSPEPQRAPAFVRTVDQATSTTTHERHVEERRSPPPFATTTTFRSFADEKKRQTIRSPQPGAPTTITVNETLRRSDERKERTVVGDESGSRLDFRSPDFASPTPSFVNRQADEFLRNIPIKINTFEDDARSVAPYVQHPTDFVLNDTTTTTTTVEVFRANAEEPVDFYKLPPGPLDDRGGPQLIRARGPGYEVHSNTETRFGDTPLAHWANEPGGLRTSAPFSTTTNTKTVQWDPAKPAVVGGGGEWASDEEADGELAPTIAADPLDTRVFPPRSAGRPGGVDTILRKQFLENRTEVLSREPSTANRTFSPGGGEFDGRETPLERPQSQGASAARSPPAFASTPTPAIVSPPSQRRAQAREVSFEDEEHQRVVYTPVRTRDDRERSPPSRRSPIQRPVTPTANPQATPPTARRFDSRRRSPSAFDAAPAAASSPVLKRRAQAADASGAPRLQWEYNAAQRQRPPPPRTLRSPPTERPSRYSTAVAQQPAATWTPPTRVFDDGAEAVVSRADGQRIPRSVLRTSGRRRTASHSPPTARPAAATTPQPAASVYGRPTLVYTPRNPEGVARVVEDDYYARMRDEQLRRMAPAGGAPARRHSPTAPPIRSRSPSPWEWERPGTPNYRMGNRSASPNEMYKLYQTRDCLGNILYEFDPSDAKGGTRDPPPPYPQRPTAPARATRVYARDSVERRPSGAPPIARHSPPTSKRASRSMEEEGVSFDDLNNVRLVADGTKLRIVQEGKV